jgi:hypothetical protein
LARLLTDDGAALLSDDVLRVDWEDDVPLARAGTSSSRLRSNSLVGCREATTSADGRIVVVDGVAAPDPVSLRAVLAPLLSPAYREVRVIRHPSRAALFVLAAAHPLDGLLGLDLLADHFEHAARIAGAAPVLRVEVPWPGRANAGLASCIRRLVDTELEMFEPDTFEPDTCGPDGTGLQSASVDRG